MRMTQLDAEELTCILDTAFRALLRHFGDPNSHSKSRIIF